MTFKIMSGSAPGILSLYITKNDPCMEQSFRIYHIYVHHKLILSICYSGELNPFPGP